MFDLTPIGQQDPGDIFIKLLVMGNTGAGKTRFGARNDKGDTQVVVLLCEPNGKATIAEINPRAVVVDVKKESAKLVKDLKAADKAIPLVPDLEIIRRFMRFAISGALVSSFPEGTRIRVVADSLTEMQRLLKDEIQKQNEVRARREEDPEKRRKILEFSIRDWGVLTERTRMLLRTFRDLPCDVVGITLAEEDKDEEAGVRYVKPQFEGRKMPNEVGGYFSGIGYSFRREVQKEGKDKSTIYRVLWEGPGRYKTKACCQLTGVTKPDPDLAFGLVRASWMAGMLSDGDVVIPAEGEAPPKDEPKDEEPENGEPDLPADNENGKPKAGASWGA